MHFLPMAAVLELFEHIRKENPRPYLKYLVESFWSQLGNFRDLPSVNSLKVKYEQSLESVGTKSTVNVEATKRIDERALDKEEEDYFNEDSDEENTASASVSHVRKVQTFPISSNGSAPSEPILSFSSKPSGLVDYDDDEDDNYKPPPRRQTDPSDEDEGTLETLSMKRKLVPKEEKPGLGKKRRLDKDCKSNKSVFSALCSTLSQAVLPNKKAANVIARTLDKSSHQEKEAKDCTSSDHKNCSLPDENSGEENATAKNCSDSNSKSQDNGQFEEEDHDDPQTATNSTPEMAVNGS